ncbi:MAG: glycosyltransferase family 2 protein [Verrucomicrobia bacterium]|nr:glycosyltransferase family 2 protein [Verrucomicrobiota bacterium]
MTTAPDSAPFVAAVTATYRRAEELRRCLRSLVQAGPELGAVVVVDNGGSGVDTLGEEFPDLPIHPLYPAQNLGFGGGLALAMRMALANYGEGITHFLILDDDVELPPGCLSALLAGVGMAQARAGCPMVVGSDGQVGWFPGLNAPGPWQAIRRATIPADYLDRYGEKPISFSWSTFVCLLVAAEAVRAVGLPREDYWVRGEDLEYSLRLTNRFPSAFLPGITVRHLVPARGSQTGLPDDDRLKSLAMLQNSAYTSAWLPHGRRLLRHLPGNIYRFLQLPGGGLADALAVLHALWNGFIKARPAGAAGADLFRRTAAEEKTTPPGGAELSAEATGSRR